MKMWMVLPLVIAVFAGACASAPEETGGESQEVALAQQLQNPLANLISVPMQLNRHQNMGPDDKGDQWVLNIQPVLPFKLNDDWTLISRTIFPLIRLDDLPLKGEKESGLGDITQSFFLSPSQLTSGGWVWGVGPVFLIPTASDEDLGTEKFGLGPTAVALKQTGPWTVGVLVNHVWSVAGDDDRDSVNATYVEPWLTYTTDSDTSISVSFETVHDWQADETSLPVNFIVDQLLKIGEQYISVGGALNYHLDTPPGGPEGLGFRLQLTLLC